MVGGAYGGSLHHKGLKLSDEDKGRIAADLSSGKAAVGVLAPVDQGAFIQEKLIELAVPPRSMTWWTRPHCRPR